MNTYFKQASVALALVVAAGAAAASTPIPTVTGAIGAHTAAAPDLITLPAAASASFTATITGSAATGVGDVLTFGLYDAGNHLVPTASAPVDTILSGLYRESYTLYFNALTAGSYSLKLSSGLVGGTYKITGSYAAPTTAVPEPVSLALSLAGLAVVLASRRRRAD